MDNNFQTSFIPKKPITIETSKTGSGVNIFLLISIFIFITATVASAGVYFWHATLVKGLSDKVANLKRLQQEEPATLENIIAFDRQLKLTDELLKNHVAVSPLFDYLQKNTVQNVRFKSLTFTNSDKNSLKMSGVAKDFNTIASQSDAFKRTRGIINPIFSNFSPTVTGSVSFDLVAEIDSDLISYKAQTEGVSDTNDINSSIPSTSNPINNF